MRNARRHRSRIIYVSKHALWYWLRIYLCAEWLCVVAALCVCVMLSRLVCARESFAGGAHICCDARVWCAAFLFVHSPQIQILLPPQNTFATRMLYNTHNFCWPHKRTSRRPNVSSSAHTDTHTQTLRHNDYGARFECLCVFASVCHSTVYSVIPWPKPVEWTGGMVRLWCVTCVHVYTYYMHKPAEPRPTAFANALGPGSNQSYCRRIGHNGHETQKHGHLTLPINWYA